MSQGLPLVVPLTVTFSLGSIRPDQVLREYERFYLRLCSLLMNNHERPSKRDLLPFALAFRDDPSTRPRKHRERPGAFAFFSNHPSVAPHVHSLIVVHPRLVDRFLGIVGTLEETWRRIPVWTADPTSAHDAPRYVNRSLYTDVPLALGIRELMEADPVGSRLLVRARIRRVVGYCAKLGRRCRDVRLMLRPMGIPPFGGRLLPMRLMATRPTGTAKEATTQSACLVCGGNTHPISTTAMCARNSCLRRSISNASMSTWCVARCAWAPISRLSLG